MISLRPHSQRLKSATLKSLKSDILYLCVCFNRVLKQLNRWWEGAMKSSVIDPAQFSPTHTRTQTIKRYHFYDPTRFKQMV